MQDDLNQKLLNFMGVGNPQNPYWFIGYEEPLFWDKIKDVENLINCDDYTYYEEGWFTFEKLRLKQSFPYKRFTQVFDVMAQIIIQVEQKTFEENPTDFIDEKLLTEKGYGFQMNLYPVGKEMKSDKLSLDILNKLGFEKSREYYATLRNKRFSKLKGFWEKFQPKFTICYGTNKWNDYIQLFDIKSDDSSKNKDFKLFEKERIILAPFLYPRDMPKEKVKILSGFMANMTK